MRDGNDSGSNSRFRRNLSSVRRLLDGFEDVIVLGRLSRRARERAHGIVRGGVTARRGEVKRRRRERRKITSRHAHFLSKTAEIGQAKTRDAIQRLSRFRSILASSESRGFERRLHFTSRRKSILPVTPGRRDHRRNRATLLSQRRRRSQLCLLVVAGRPLRLFRDEYKPNRSDVYARRREEISDGIFNPSSKNHQRR